MNNGRGDVETVISDWAMSVIEARLRDTFRVVPDATEFATFVQPPRYIVRGPGDEGWLPEMAVFIVKSPHPTRGTPAILTHGTVQRSVFDQSEPGRDPALMIFSAVLRQHLTTLSNLKALIH